MLTIKEQLSQALYRGSLGERLRNTPVGCLININLIDDHLSLKVYDCLATSPCTGCIFNFSKYSLNSVRDDRQCAFIHCCTSPHRIDRTSVIFANYRKRNNE